MSRKAEKIWEELKEGKRTGYHPHHFQTLYLGFGFKMRHGRSHDVFKHPDYAFLMQTIPRHQDKELGSGYANQAFENIETLLRLKGEISDDE